MRLLAAIVIVAVLLVVFPCGLLLLGNAVSRTLNIATRGWVERSFVSSAQGAGARFVDFGVIGILFAALVTMLSVLVAGVYYGLLSQ